jgi:hypothetical protein
MTVENSCVYDLNVLIVLDPREDGAKEFERNVQRHSVSGSCDLVIVRHRDESLGQNNCESRIWHTVKQYYF